MNYEKMVADNLGLAHMMVRKYPLPRGYDYEDMYQEACIAIYMAAKEFDPAKGFKFSTIATRHIAERFYRIFRSQNADKRTGICISIFSPTTDNLELIDMISNDSAINPMNEAIASETLETLLEADEKLVMLKLEGMTQAEIGKEIGCYQVYVSRKLRKLKALVS